ncbi:hypothetical protein PENSPDRAFT_755272 [Peniophora sp. CONT]|nr:hypothetical protein PENSPDRAFT_755272 [Peniophora sp. CONT]
MPVPVATRSPSRASIPRACKKPAASTLAATAMEEVNTKTKAGSAKDAGEHREEKQQHVVQTVRNPAQGAKAFISTLSISVAKPSAFHLRFTSQDERSMDTLIHSLEELQLESLFAGRSALSIIAFLLLMNYDEQRACADELARNGVKAYDYEYTATANAARPKTAQRVRARIAQAVDTRRKIAEEDLWNRQYLNEQRRIREGLMKPSEAKITKPPPLKGTARPLRRHETIIEIPLSATIGHTPIPPLNTPKRLHGEMHLTDRAFVLKGCLRRAMVNKAQRRWWRAEGKGLQSQIKPMPSPEFGGMLGVMLGALLLEVLWTAY